MKAELLSFDQMCLSDRQNWQHIRSQSATLSSPFLSPEFIEVVSKVRPQTRIAILESQGEKKAFWPMEVTGKTAIPVAFSVNEIAGLVQPEDFQADLANVLKQLQLAKWKFDCVPATQRSFQPHQLQEHRYHWICIANGFDQYLNELKSHGSRQLEYHRRKLRKIERELGKIEFRWNDNHGETWSSLLNWKRNQYRQTKTADVLGIPWVQRMLLQFLEIQEKSQCRGILSGLYLGDRPIALNYGLLEGETLAIWFPAYDPEYAHFSPGSLLFLRLLQEAALRGVKRVELGQGEERYKLSFGNRTIRTYEGLVTNSSLAKLAHATKVRLRTWGEKSALGQVPLNAIRMLKNKWRF